jgi:hypothetical protein
MTAVKNGPSVGGSGAAAAQPVESLSTVGKAVLRWPYGRLLVVSAIAFACVLYLTSYKDFYFDEWDFIISRRSWSLAVFILPRFYYMSAIPILIWKVLFLIFGLRTYVPYEAVLLANDVAAVLLLFALIRRRSGDLPAFAASLTLLLFGAGSYDIVFAFQICYVGAIAFGLLAMNLIIDTSHFRRRVVAISLALIAGLMCHLMALAFIAAISIEVGLDSKRRRLLLALVGPVIAFVAWYLAFDTGSFRGTPGVTTELLRGPTGMALVTGIAGFVFTGLEATAAGAFGLTLQAGIAVLAALASWLALSWSRRRKIDSWQLGMVAGLLTFFFLTGLGRLQFGVNYASQSRYVYAGAVFMLPLIANAVRELPWRGLWRPALSVVFALALLSNIIQLQAAARSQVEFMTVENAELQTVEFFRGAPDMAMDHFIDARTMWALHAGEYLAARDELGSPVPALSAANDLSQLPSWAVDRVMVNLFGSNLILPSGNSESLSLPCQNVDSSTASTLEFLVPDNQTLMLEPSQSGFAVLSLGLMNPPAPISAQQIELPASKPLFLHLPNTGKATLWQLWIRTTQVGVLRVCSEVAPLVARLSRYEELAASFTPGQGWSYVKEAAAISHWAAKASSRTPGPEGAFGDSFIPTAGAYDIWYRARVADGSSRTPEMLLTVVDLQSNRYMGAASFSPSQVGTTYRWMLVASNVTPASNHTIRFQTNIATQLSTDWYIDQAALVPAGTPMP